VGLTCLDAARNALARGVDRIVGAPIAVVIGGRAAVARRRKDGVGARAEHAPLTRARPEAAIAIVIHTARHVCDALTAGGVRNAIAVRVVTGSASVGRRGLNGARSPLRVGATRLLPEGAVAESVDARADISRRTLTTGAQCWHARIGAAAGCLRNPVASPVVTPLRHARGVTSSLPCDAHAAGGCRRHADGRVAAAGRENLPLSLARTGARRLPVATRGTRQTLHTTARETSPCGVARDTRHIRVVATDRRSRLPIALDVPFDARGDARAILAERASGAGQLLKPPVGLTRSHFSTETARRLDLGIAFDACPIRAAHCADAARGFPHAARSANLRLIVLAARSFSDFTRGARQGTLDDARLGVEAPVVNRAARRSRETGDEHRHRPWTPAPHATVSSSTHGRSLALRDVGVHSGSRRVTGRRDRRGRGRSNTTECCDHEARCIGASAKQRLRCGETLLNIKRRRAHKHRRSGAVVVRRATRHGTPGRRATLEQKD